MKYDGQHFTHKLIEMKKVSLLLILFTPLLLRGQFNPTYNSIKFKAGGLINQLITYPTNDSIKINGITYYMNGGMETDPVWLSEKSGYYTKIQSDAAFLTPAGVSTISGAKIFNSGKLILQGSGTAATILNTLASGIPDNAYVINFPTGSGTVALTSDVSKVSRYSAYSSGSNNVEVLADGDGITASIANGNELTFTIPSGTKIISAKIRLGSGFSTLKVFLGTNDMTNGYAGDRWMPITQAWREDTGQQLMGLTTVMDLFRFDKFSINGLISTTPNLIRVSF